VGAKSACKYCLPFYASEDGGSYIAAVNSLFPDISLVTLVSLRFSFDMDLVELRPDINSELSIFTRAARLVRAQVVGRFARRYNLPGERRTRGGKRPLARTERDVLSRSRHNGLCLQKF